MEKLCFCQDLLVELQVKDEGLAEGFHREAALSQMDGLVGESKERLRQDGRDHLKPHFTGSRWPITEATDCLSFHYLE